MKRTISVIIATIIIIQNLLFGITVYANDTTNDYIYKYMYRKKQSPILSDWTLSAVWTANIWLFYSLTLCADICIIIILKTNYFLEKLLIGFAVIGAQVISLTAPSPANS